MPEVKNWLVSPDTFMFKIGQIVFHRTNAYEPYVVVRACVVFTDNELSNYVTEYGCASELEGDKTFTECELFVPEAVEPDPETPAE